MTPQPPYAQLQAINYLKLLDQNKEEIDKLSKACHEDGFFYLDLNDDKYQGILQDWKTLLPLVNSWFNKPLDEKMKYNYGTVRHGYALFSV